MTVFLVNSQAEVLQALFIALGLGSAPPTPPAPCEAWPVYATNEPSQPDNCITVYDTSNQKDGRSMPTGEVFEHYGFQVRIRSVDHPTGRQQAILIKQTLEEEVYRVPVIVGSNEYFVHCVNSLTIQALGKDTPNSRRSLFTINGLVALHRPGE